MKTELINEVWLTDREVEILTKYIQDQEYGFASREEVGHILAKLTYAKKAVFK